jgi:hypothetical protein
MGVDSKTTEQKTESADFDVAAAILVLAREIAEMRKLMNQVGANARFDAQAIRNDLAAIREALR